MAALILLNKPFQTLCQFSDDQGRATLGDYVDIPGVYPAGRLDYDSEGLVLLTSDGGLQHRIASPRQKMTKTYLVQVEGEISDEALERLRRGLDLKDGPTRPAAAQRIDPPALWPRHPPVRERANIPTSWLELKLTEGRNRQVRRMTAATGYPTLRLVRWRIGEWSVDGLAPGESRSLTVHLPARARAPARAPNRPGRKPDKRRTRHKT
ncbi:pseudouridine synthase [Marinobacter lacisalsi]|uniref:Pseudouridine synthase n=1 Tax=Marinobacter lacisalsi TaxID=475979 RepID=A0ABV8QLX6_9GAMM